MANIISGFKNCKEMLNIICGLNFLKNVKYYLWIIKFVELLEWWKVSK